MLFKEITVEEFAEIRAREAYDEGVAKGEKSGAAQKEREIAKNLKALGLELDKISKSTGLTPSEIEEL